jgi:putative AlgH/UPF0301 family transcriptional regulator
MSKPTAAARAAALLHQLDEDRRQREAMRHSPTCPGGPVTTQTGFTVRVSRCDVCGAVSSTRRIHPTPTPAPQQ